MEPTSRVAVYLDFENLVISQYDDMFGRGAWGNDRPLRPYPQTAVRERLKAAAINVDAIVDFAASVGVVTICRAYGNWSASAFADYGPVLTSRSVDLVQLFPLAGAKNGADIRLATDVIDDLARFPHLTHVLVAAGDSDYLAVAQKARRLGKQVVGVGVSGSIGKYWQSACDEFKRYDTLVRLGVQGESADGSAALAPDELLRRALRLCEQQRGADRVPPGVLKAVMRRLSPTFDEQALGYKNFTTFLVAHSSVVLLDASKQYVYAPTDAVAEDLGPPAAHGPSTVESCRNQLPYISPSSWPLVKETYDHVVLALHALWELLQTSECESMPHAEWNKVLVSRGVPSNAASRSRSFCTQILTAAVRSETGAWEPNLGLVALDRDGVEERLNHGIVIRMHLRCPEATPRDLARAVHGSDADAAQVERYTALIQEFNLSAEPPASDDAAAASSNGSPQERKPTAPETPPPIST